MSDSKKNETVDAGKKDEQVENKTTDTTVDAGKKDEQVDAGAAMQARCADITGCEEAKGREALANHFAFKTNMSVDDAKAALAAAPKQSTSATGKSPLDTAMDASGGGADIANNGGDGEEESAKDDGGLLGAFVGATGNKSVLRVVK